MGNLIKYLPTVLPFVIEAVMLAEFLFSGSGTGVQKREYVVKLVKLAILAAEGITEKEIADEALFSYGVGQLVDGIVSILNSTKKFGEPDSNVASEDRTQ